MSGPRGHWSPTERIASIKETRFTRCCMLNSCCVPMSRESTASNHGVKSRRPPLLADVYKQPQPSKRAREQTSTALHRLTQSWRPAIPSVSLSGPSMTSGQSSRTWREPMFYSELAQGHTCPSSPARFLFPDLPSFFLSLISSSPKSGSSTKLVSPLSSSSSLAAQSVLLQTNNRQPPEKQATNSSDQTSR